MSSNSLINLGELSKPATMLVKKISDAVGGTFKPWQITRVARAEAESDLIAAESQIQITDLHRRAMHRFLDEEAKKQSNIEDITQEALPLLEDNSLPENVDDDWITNFFDKCRIVSDDDMQRLWARTLAGEANAPGAFSRRTINLIADLDKSDAQLFQNLCGFGWNIGNVVPLVFDPHGEIYNRNGLDFDSLNHLNSLGLIQFDHISGFCRTKLPRKINVFYYGRAVELTLPKDSDNELETGNVLLTKAGQELVPVCGSGPVNGFFEFVHERWAGKSLVPSIPTEHDAEPVRE